MQKNLNFEEKKVKNENSQNLKVFCPKFQMLIPVWQTCEVCDNKQKLNKELFVCNY